MSDSRQVGQQRVTADFLTQGRESEEQFRLFMSRSPAAAYMKDRDGRYLFVNPVMERAFNRPLSAWVGKTDFDLFPVAEAEQYRANDQRVLAAGAPIEVVEAATQEDGPHHYLSFKYPFLGGDGRVLLAGMSLDITRQKRAEDALRASEERFARFMQHLPGLAWVKDADGRYVFANDAAVKAFGTPRADLYGKTDAEVFPFETASQFRENDQQALAGVSGVRTIETLEHDDGLVHHSLVSKFPIPTTAGQPLMVGGVAIDVTEELKTRAVLEESEERFRATFDQAAVGIAHVGTDGRWLRVNKKLCDIVGYAPDELLRLTFQDITHPEDVGADLAQLRRLVAGEIATYSMEKRYFHKDRRTVWINLTVALARTPAGEPKYLISVVEDITGKKAIEGALRDSERQYRTLFDNMAEEVHYWKVERDERGRITTWRLVDANPPALRTWGKSLDAIRGRTTDEIFGPGSTEHYRAVVEKVMAEGIPHAYEDYFPALDRHFRFTTVPVGDYFITTGADITAIQKAHESLRRSEDRYRTVLQSITDAFFAVDRDWRFTYVNRQAETLLGRTPGELLGRGLWDEYPGLVESEFGPAYRRVMAARVTESVTSFYPDHDRWYEVHVYPADDGISVYFRDVSGRMRADEALRAGEERYRTLFSSMDEGYCIIEVIFDPPESGLAVDYRFIEVNPAFEAQAGMRGVVGRRMLEFVPTIENHWLENYGRVALTGEPIRFANEYTGLNRWFEVYAFRVGAPGAHRVAVLFTDITSRKRAQRELAEAHEFLHSSLDALSSHIAVLDESGVILAVNDAWRRFADENRYDGHNYGVGANYIEACEPNSVKCVDVGMVTGLKDVLAGRVPYFEFEYPCHSPTEERWFVMRATQFKSPGPVRVVVAHEDVTQRKRAEEALKDADRRKDEFLATLAHELRNPLAPIRNGLEVMRLSNGDREMVEKARGMMERQLSQMVHLVDDLLDLSRVSRGKIELRRERIDLARAVQQAVETSRPQIETNGHHLTISLPPGPVYVDADITRLAQVFSNLLNNAAKYTEQGGRVELSVQRQVGEVAVSVRDNGVGIPANMLPRVFEMFAQVDRSLERSQGGLGIGLSIVKKLVEMHGGSVAVESGGHGAGSEFTVRLPVVLSVAMPTDGDEEHALPSSRRKILVVDDNKDAATSLAMMLKLMGNETKTAHDGVEALDVAATYRPDLILLDIGMPRLNGYETAKQIRLQAWGKSIVLVALTGWGQEEDRRKSSEAGFDSHMVKPVEPAALERLLASMANRTV
ncbi:PAS domain-containing protein [Planctomyces sp. SH-PL14]|uniref:PAS domain-containing protein n=1 Tax=Planctomyces sp. SH-PL14 TaxID=1632864 RepID=UPI00078E0CBF|nr:PAS domain-containing protein [Planctomyces sp. SH-PL14]AMV17383.1 Autoinducer 2 sensor kinase/phosphatase LuxQ [Planctomyces sp. SH-PL14]